jgi:hypothetical protein
MTQVDWAAEHEEMCNEALMAYFKALNLHSRFETLTALKIQVGFFSVVIPCSVMVEYQPLKY